MHNLLLPSTTILLLLVLRVSSAAHPFTKIYAFGDSNTDTGNYNRTQPSKLDYFYKPPYGSTYFHHPSHRCSDGRLIVDFLASALSLPLLPPYLTYNRSCHGVNFATVFSSSFDEQFLLHNTSADHDFMPTTLGAQLRLFDSYMEETKGCGLPECGEAMDGALFWVGQFGYIDYLLGIASLIPPEVLRQQSVHSVITFLRIILRRGAKYIFVQGVPPMGCLPWILSLQPVPEHIDINGCDSVINAQVEAHNSHLEENLQKLRRLFPDAFISYVDIYTAHLSVIKEFKSNGFDEPFKVCCGAGGPPYNFDFDAPCGSPKVAAACSQPSKYVNWDGFHLTDAMNERMAELLFHGGHCRPPLSAAFVKSDGM